MQRILNTGSLVNFYVIVVSFISVLLISVQYLQAENFNAGIDYRMSDEFDSSVDCDEALNEIQLGLTQIDYENGIDLVYEFTNLSNTKTRLLPVLNIAGFGNISHDKDAHYLELIKFPHFRSFLEAANGRLYSPVMTYPSELYSPVIVAGDICDAVGISLLYPIAADSRYEHNVKIRFHEQPSDRKWRARFALNGCLAPGEKRTYTVTIRTTNRASQWLQTLEPYKTYFQSLYQDENGNLARYQRCTEPVFGYSVANNQYYHPRSNPRSFRGDLKGQCDPCSDGGWMDYICRPDLYGWQSTVDDLQCWAESAGFKHLMIWSAAGVWPPDYECEGYPPHFMTHWPDLMVETQDEWLRVSNLVSDCNLYFWWGSSATFAGGEWKGGCEDFDPDDLYQRKLMLQEWQLAIDRGATGLGLDAFNDMPLWKALPWINTLRETARNKGLDNAMILAEPLACDIMHLYVPTFLPSKYDSAGETVYVNGPHKLADYLIPENEIWCQLRPEDENWEDEDWVNRARELACYGYRVITHHKRITNVSQFYPPNDSNCSD